MTMGGKALTGLAGVKLSEPNQTLNAYREALQSGDVR